MVFLFRRQPSSLDRTSDFESDFLANNTRKKIACRWTWKNTGFASGKRTDGRRERRDRRNNEGERQTGRGGIVQVCWLAQGADSHGQRKLQNGRASDKRVTCLLWGRHPSNPRLGGKFTDGGLGAWPLLGAAGTKSVPRQRRRRGRLSTFRPGGPGSEVSLLCTDRWVGGH